MIPWDRAYRGLLGLYPPGFRAEFEAEMLDVFGQAYAEARRHGRRAVLVLWAREVRDLPLRLWVEYRAIPSRQKGGLAMNRMAPEVGRSPGLSPARETGSWSEALWAALPHLLLAACFVLPFGTVMRGTTSYPVWLIGLPVLLGLVLIFAWRRGWPRWAVSWYVYAGLVLLLVPPSLMVLLPVGVGVWLCWLMRRDPVRGLLAATPLALVSWSPVLEFTRRTAHEGVLLGLIVLAGVLALALVRFNSLRWGVWLALGASGLMGLLAAYARTFWHTLPPEHAGPATLAAVLELWIPQGLAGATFILGPLLIHRLRGVGHQGGTAGRHAYRLAVAGVLLAALGQTGYLWQMSAAGGPGQRWFNGAVYLGVALIWVGSVRVGWSVRPNLTGSGLPALWALAASAWPLMGMLPFWFSNRVRVAGLPVSFSDLGAPEKNLIYGVGLIWLLVSLWLTTRTADQTPFPA